MQHQDRLTGRLANRGVVKLQVHHRAGVELEVPRDPIGLLGRGRAGRLGRRLRQTGDERDNCKDGFHGPSCANVDDSIPQGPAPAVILASWIWRYTATDEPT